MAYAARGAERRSTLKPAPSLHVSTGALTLKDAAGAVNTQGADKTMRDKELFMRHLPFPSTIDASMISPPIVTLLPQYVIRAR
ncbi:hypothetical protein KDH_08770 [Dictyobacter sp. S3.2.2.5]|uniref:Uncharacterized protein n=1 Tax=Dictyobacter halimunensis TaxID=3026934 RepID=A0ABQ6FNC6_9CHLR|nr:hypothetical protein KDH_08770 [Dictyobacter sp. S3.2.2.5]